MLDIANGSFFLDPPGQRGPQSETRPSFGTLATRSHGARFIKTISELSRRSNTICLASGDTRSSGSQDWPSGR